MTVEQKQAIQEAAINSYVSGRNSSETAIIDSIISAIKTYDEVIANKPTPSSDISDILYRQIHMLAAWNENEHSTCDFRVARIEQLRKNAETIASLAERLNHYR